MSKKLVTIARGDGIGPELMDAVLHILGEAGAELEYDEIVVGDKMYAAGNTAGIDAEAWKSLEHTKVFLKAPITTPQGKGVKSLNVTIRKAFGMFANVRPTYSYHPFIQTKHHNMDLVIIRENEEGLYAGVEYHLSPQVMNAYKLISSGGTERIVRFAFEFATRNNRKKVTCFTKDNILKITDGHFHKCFDKVAQEYPDIEAEHWIVDIGCAKLADSPELFDVIVMPNLYGDILSDMAGQISGSVGIAGSANIGEEFAMFEAIHGSAPRRAGQNLANPSGFLLGAVLMMAYLGQSDVATRIHNAWLTTIELGYHTYDIFQEGVSKIKCGTKEFAEAVASNLGSVPNTLKPVQYASWSDMKVTTADGGAPATIETIGVDVFVHYSAGQVGELVAALQQVDTGSLKLDVVGNRGTKLWPDGAENTAVSDVWQCRFRVDAAGVAVEGGDGDVVGNKATVNISALVQVLERAGFVINSLSRLLHINGERSYSLIQGE